LVGRHNVKGEPLKDEFAVEPFEDLFNLSEHEDRVEKLSSAIQDLPERERLIVTLHHYEHLAPKEIGKIVGLSEERVGQIYTQAISRLREALSACGKGAEASPNAQ